MRFSVNGVPVTLESEASASGGQGDVSTIFIPKDDDIYPTLTLQSLSTQVRAFSRSASPVSLVLHLHSSSHNLPFSLQPSHLSRSLSFFLPLTGARPLLCA